ncbi:MAG: hypothetical protein WCL27_14985, partial [Betaproteobacteria bacterium]
MFIQHKHQQPPSTLADDESASYLQLSSPMNLSADSLISSAALKQQDRGKRASIEKGLGVEIFKADVVIV